MAMKCPPARCSPTVWRMRSMKYCSRMLGSSVVPDLLDTMNSVRLRSTAPSVAAICAGSVESSTCNSGKPLVVPNVCRITSAPRLDPPMPSSTACRTPESATSRAASFNGPMCANWSSVTFSQPSQPFSSAPVQSVASFAHKRRTLPDRCQSATTSETLGRKMLRQCVGLPVEQRCDLAASPLVYRREQAIEGLAEERDAVFEQPVGHVVEGDSDALERGETSRARPRCCLQGSPAVGRDRGRPRASLA